ncbi:uncharacterized protein N7511_005471 [Penicillium nucicola]|uniref:uncharacterized protein n=1 Tax=Penicillium nucicola TaxID=1850975 RepID=UPI0025451939|nr:uncharacterized protein N7511_005471 [Penicillium nucicola]KAJ5762089.1 hypothetical protein N7511_005471 [Penicillium nucicola]
MASFLAWCTGAHRRAQKAHWRQIEESASNLESLPSWNAPDNKLIMQTFEWHVPADRQHWRRLANALPGYQAIGIDQLWIPPGCKGMDVNGNGYDIYDLYDLGEFDQKGAVPTKWGSRGDLESFLEQARGLGMGVIWDAVLNHKAGADFPEAFPAVKVDPKRRDLDLSKPIEVNGWTGFDFQGRGEKYSSMKYRWEHFSGVDWDDKSKENAIFKITGPGKDWAQDVSTENGNYDYLMFADLDLAHPAVRDDLLQWGTWITNALSLSGMRLDAAKHFSVGFQRAFVEHVRKTANPDFFVIGEYWTGNVKALLQYLKDTEYSLAAYDVPLVEKFCKLSHQESPDLRGIFKDTLVQCRPDHAVTIVSNHDTQPGQMLETPVAPSFKVLAYALILLRKEGHPCVFYGDIYGIRANVQDLMTPACNGNVPLLTQARKLYAYGEQQDYFDQPNCIGFVRYGNARHTSGLACVLSNAGSAVQRMYVGRERAYEEWVDILRPDVKPVVINKKGYGYFTVAAMSASIWVEAVALSRDGLRRDFDVNIYN